MLPIAAAILLALSLSLWGVLAAHRRPVRIALGFLTLSLSAWIAHTAQHLWHGNSQIPVEVARAFLELAAIRLGALIFLEILLRRTGLPKFVSEMAVVCGYVGVVVTLLYTLGVNVAGIFATSAVATAVVGLALQDMLSNIAGGILLELEGGIKPGDFIRTDVASGWVEHVRLRHTAMRTPDGDRVVVPNNFLTRSSVSIRNSPLRLFVPFHLPYSRNPQEIVETVELALRASPIPQVAADPPPGCVIRKMEPGHIEFAAVIWLSEPGHSVNPVSAVLSRVYHALQRAGVSIDAISRPIEMRHPETRAEVAHPVDVLRRTPIFRGLLESELFELAANLRHLVFAPDELIIRQGEAGDSMFFVISGRVDIVIRSDDGLRRKVAEIPVDGFIGEASLLTGQARSADASAATRVDCYRLGKEGLAALLDRRADLAEDMSRVLAHRQTELLATREELDAETAFRRESENQQQLLRRISALLCRAAGHLPACPPPGARNTPPLPLTGADPKQRKIVERLRPRSQRRSPLCRRITPNPHSCADTSSARLALSLSEA